MNASFYLTTLTGADFTDANIRGANFTAALPPKNLTGITFVQISSTASFKAHDLSGINLSHNTLAGGDFSGQILSSSTLSFTDLTGANSAHANLIGACLAEARLDEVILNGAFIRNANFERNPATGSGGLTPAQLSSTASYAAHNLSGVRLNNNLLASLSFAGQDLTSSCFQSADLTGCDFTGATITSATFDSATGFTKEQLYTTTNYLQHDIHGLVLSDLNLSGEIFAIKTCRRRRLAKRI